VIPELVANAILTGYEWYTIFVASDMRWKTWHGSSELKRQQIETRTMDRFKSIKTWQHLRPAISGNEECEVVRRDSVC
jgi:hypothetical protein